MRVSQLIDKLQELDYEQEFDVVLEIKLSNQSTTNLIGDRYQTDCDFLSVTDGKLVLW